MSSANAVKVDRQHLDRLKQSLLQFPEVKALPETNQYEAFRLKYGNELIVGYTSGKVTANGPRTRKLVAELVSSLETGDYDLMIGSDEAGKGEWLGPMVVASVALTPRQSGILRGEGVMDSKELDNDRISLLARIVKKNCTKFKIITVPPERFNHMFQEMKKEGKNLNDMLAWGHSAAISAVHEAVKGRFTRIRVVIDEFSKFKTEFRLQEKIDLDDVELIQKPRAEEEIAVAAASILAKAGYEEWLSIESEKSGIDLRKLTSKDALKIDHRGKFVKITYIKD